MFLTQNIHLQCLREKMVWFNPLNIVPKISQTDIKLTCFHVIHKLFFFKPSNFLELITHNNSIPHHRPKKEKKSKKKKEVKFTHNIININPPFLTKLNHPFIFAISTNTNTSNSTGFFPCDFHVNSGWPLFWICIYGEIT